jgi:hypothetical protein
MNTTAGTNLMPRQDKPRPRRSTIISLAIMALVLLAILTTTLVQWADNQGPLRAEGAPEEQLLNYMAGYNFYLHGFLSRGFLTDYSLDPTPDAPPVYYTHFPPLVSIIIGTLVKLGLHTLTEVRLAMNIIFVLGLVFVGLFFRRHLSVWHGIGVLVFLGINNRVVLANSDHVTYAYWFGLTFLACWGLTLRQKADRFLWLGMVGVFLISWINYTQVVVTMIALGGMWLLRIPNMTFRRLAGAVAVTAGGLVAHFFQNVLVLGWNIAFRDMYLTMGNRLVGVPGREEILNFARQNDIVLWGVNELAPVGNRFTWIINEFSHYLIPIVISLAGLLLLLYMRRRHRTTITSFKLLAIFTVANISWHLIFQAHGQADPLPITTALPIAMAGGFLLGEVALLVSEWWQKSGRQGWRSLVTLSLLPVLAFVAAAGAALWQGISLSRISSDGPGALYSEITVRELDILKQFRGHGFWTNVTPHNVAYFTESWVIGQMPLAAVVDGDVSRAYVTTLARSSPNWEAASRPHYFFFSKHNVVMNIVDQGEQLEKYRRYFESNYPVLAWSPYGSMVVDISWGPFGTSHLVPGSNTAVPSLHRQLPLEAGQIAGSSAASVDTAPGKIVTEGGYWQPAPGDEAPFLEVDLMAPQAVSVLRLLPRAGHADGMPEGNSTLFEGSSEGEDWEPLAVLGIDRDKLNGDWLSFPVYIPRPYQCYRLSFRDSGFDSLGGLEFYTVNPELGKK